MSEPGLKVSASSLSGVSAGRGSNPSTLARLQALDKNGDGRLDLDEVCDAIDDIVRKEKTERTLKWLLAALAVFSLLIVAATVGLTYAVVVLSKDTQVNDSVLQSKDTGEALRTGSFLQSQNATALTAAVAASNDPGAVLGRVSSIKVPSLKDGEAYTVHKVDAVTMLLNKSIIVRTSTGLDLMMPVDNVVPKTRRPSNATVAVQGPGRKLMAGFYDIEMVSRERGLVYLEGVHSGTVGDVIDNFAISDYFISIPPDTSAIKFTIDFDGTQALSRNTNLDDLTMDGDANQGISWLYFMQRRVTVSVVNHMHCQSRRLLSHPLPIRAESCFGNDEFLSEVFPLLDDNFRGLKREVQATYGHEVGIQILVKSGTTTRLNDEDKISTYCTASNYLAEDNCKVDVYLYALPQS